jgi:ribonuclease HI
VEKKSEIVIFCDGASKGNPGPGGWGAIVATDKEVQELGGSEKKTTNNRMELKAALEGLKAARTLGQGSTTVYTDSSYVINGITKWVHGWVKSNWITKDKKEVMNQDLWKPLADTAGYFNGRIKWIYVGGHVGVAGNERVDVIASDFAQGRTVSLYKGAQEKYEIDIKNISFDKEKQKSKSDSRSRSKMKAFSYISMIGGEVLVHKTWAECEKRVRGRSAKYKKSLSKEDESKIIAEFLSAK